jgi:hypothetical protein
MAKLWGDAQNQRERAEKRRQPIAVPRKKGLRRNVARVRNGVRRARRVRNRVAGRLSGLGGTYPCRICGATVPYRRADAHNWQHEVAREKERYQRQRQGPAPGAPPLPRQPSRTKQQAGGGKKLNKLPGTDGRKIKKVDPRRTYRRETDAIGDEMAGRTRRPNGNGGTPSAQLAGAVLKAFEAWADFQPETVEDLRSHLLSMDAALGAVPGPLNAWSAAMVQRRFHPAVVQPVDQAAEQIAGIRVYFSEAYRRFEQIYADRLGYERNQQYKPADSIFGNAG